MRLRSFTVAASLLLTAAASADTGSPYRYDDDLRAYFEGTAPVSWWSPLKYTPLDSADPNVYLSFGLDDRERIEAVSNALLGFQHRGSDIYDLHRLLLYANFRADWFRIFLQFGNHTETGRAPAALPTDTDRGDLQQGFVDVTAPLTAATALLRAGRFEMSYDDGALIGLRNGPNVRQVWDGIHAAFTDTALRVDSFLVRPVDVSPGYFDDRDLTSQSLWGLHVETTPAALGPFALNGFYYGSRMPKVLFAAGPGSEETHTFGLRSRLRADGFDGSIGAILQTGHFNDRSVLAWSAHADAGWTFAALPASPRIAARIDILSGGDDRGGTIHTFNALYPNYSFSTEATIEAPSNLIQPAIELALHPSPPTHLTYKIEGLWRYSVRDAFYAAPTFALIRPDGTNRSWSGLEQQLAFAWAIGPHLSVDAAYVHFAPGGFLRAHHASAEDFGMTEIAFRF